MAYSVSDIITWAKASQALSAIGESKKRALIGGKIDKDLHIKLYVERSILEETYDADPSDTLEVQYGISNYVYALCGTYVFEAQNATGGGSSSIPGTAISQQYPISITEADFTTATLYPNTQLFGVNIDVYLNQINRYLESSEFEVLPTGLNILIDGFDATVNQYKLVIEKVYY